MDHLHIDANSALLRLPERRWRTAVAAGPIAFDETFTDLDLARFDGVGHFPRREDPDRAVFAIATFFAWLAAAH